MQGDALEAAALTPTKVGLVFEKVAEDIGPSLPSVIEDPTPPEQFARNLLAEAMVCAGVGALLIMVPQMMGYGIGSLLAEGLPVSMPPPGTGQGLEHLANHAAGQIQGMAQVCGAMSSLAGMALGLSGAFKIRAWSDNPGHYAIAGEVSESGTESVADPQSDLPMGQEKTIQEMPERDGTMDGAVRHAMPQVCPHVAKVVAAFSATATRHKTRPGVSAACDRIRAAFLAMDEIGTYGESARRLGNRLADGIPRMLDRLPPGDTMPPRCTHVLMLATQSAEAMLDEVRRGAEENALDVAAVLEIDLNPGVMEPRSPAHI